MQSIEEITQKYAGKNLAAISNRKRYKGVLDKHDDTDDRGHWVATDGPEMVKHVTFAGFQLALWQEINRSIGLSEQDISLVIEGKIKSPWIAHQKNQGKINQMITHILSNDPRGIYLEGKTGRGKTFLMDCIIRVNNKYVALGCVNVKKISTTAYYDTIMDCEKAGTLQPIDRSIQGTTFVDDFYYRGDPISKLWGKEYNMPELITERMYQQSQRGHRMYSTSNFSIEDLRPHMYGPIWSRMRSMFLSIVWHGDDDYRLVGFH